MLFKKENVKKKVDMQEVFKQNLKYISNTEIEPQKIQNQFIKTDTRFYWKVGEIDCPSGTIIVSDPLCYLASGKCCPILEQRIPTGTYPVEVSIIKSPDAGIRMCTVRLKTKETTALKYQCATPTEATAAFHATDGIVSGFPVDAGMISICDQKVAAEYQKFLDQWYQEHPDGNHYDDYFAKYFQESYDKYPEYQREEGDFIEWTNPDTNHKMVMVASGFGDGFYQSYWGYDEENEICELIVPLIDADLLD